MIGIVGIAINFLEYFLSEHGQKLPAEIAGAVGNALYKLRLHRADLISQPNIEAQRGA